MPVADDALALAEQRLAEVEAMQQRLHALRDQVAEYHALLSQKLESMQQAASTPPPLTAATGRADLVSDLEASAKPEASAEPVYEEVDIVEEGEEGDEGAERHRRTPQGQPHPASRHPPGHRRRSGRLGGRSLGRRRPRPARSGRPHQDHPQRPPRQGCFQFPLDQGGSPRLQA